MKRDTKKIGDVSEAVVLAAFVRVGQRVAIPFGENQRYDLIVEIDGALCRVQVKTGRLRKGVIIFNCCSTHTHRNGVASRKYVGEIEYFAVYCPDNNDVFLVPVDDVGVVKGSLRVDKTRNNQSRLIRHADQYRIGNALLGSRGKVPLWST